jgi:transmembrane sensor
MEEYTDWEKIGKHLKGENSDEERKAFSQWLKESEENQRKYEEIERIWNAAELQKEDITPDIEKGWKAFEQKIKVNQPIVEPEETKVIPLYSSMTFKIAATVLLVLALGYTAPLVLSEKTIEVQTAQKETREIVLPDSSKVWLNKGSKLSYSEEFNVENRIVHLSGEAFFEVKKADGKTFTILSNNSKTEVLGTEFNVRGYENELQVQVTVMEGKVSFSSKDDRGKVFLLPGEKGMISKAHVVEKMKSERNNEMAWKTKQLSFENTHLSDVLQTLEQYFDTDISVNNKDILNCRFTGNFENPDLKEILEVLAVSVDLKYKENGGDFRLEGMGCK